MRQLFQGRSEGFKEKHLRRSEYQYDKDRPAQLAVIYTPGYFYFLDKGFPFTFPI